MAGKTSLLCGVGRNDAGYPVTTNTTVNGRSKRTWCCPIYAIWKQMIERCYDQKSHGDRPTYVGCSVDPEWHSFAAFRAWVLPQDYQGKHLDKDLLEPGNRIYSTASCVFIEPRLNRFLNVNAAVRGEWPIGVSLEKGKFKAQCSNPFTAKSETIGRFDSAEEAHAAWRRRKHSLACQYADLQTDQRIAAALRRRFSTST